jgi:hypothetical protein
MKKVSGNAGKNDKICEPKSDENLRNRGARLCGKKRGRSLPDARRTTY